MLYVEESFGGPCSEKIGPGSSRQPGIKTREAEAALAAGDLPCPLYNWLAWSVCLFVCLFVTDSIIFALLAGKWAEN